MVYSALASSALRHMCASKMGYKFLMSTFLNHINTNHRRDKYKFLRSYLMMENLFESSVLMVTLTASAFPFAFFLANLFAKRVPSIEQRLFDKAKLKYTDGDNT